MEEKENNEESHMLSLEEHEKSKDFCEEGQSRTEYNSRKEKKKKRKKEKRERKERKEKKEKQDEREKEKKKKELEEGHMAVTENNERLTDQRGSENNDDDEKNPKKFNQMKNQFEGHMEVNENNEQYNPTRRNQFEQSTNFCREEPCTVENNSKREENKEGKDTNGRHSENNNEKKQKNEQYSPTRRNQYEQNTNFCRKEPCIVENNSKREENKEDKDTNGRCSENNDGEYTTEDTTIDFTPQAQNQDDQSYTSDEEDWDNNKKYEHVLTRKDNRKAWNDFDVVIHSEKIGKLYKCVHCVEKEHYSNNLYDFRCHVIGQHLCSWGICCATCGKYFNCLKTARTHLNRTKCATKNYSHKNDVLEAFKKIDDEQKEIIQKKRKAPSLKVKFGQTSKISKQKKISDYKEIDGHSNQINDSGTEIGTIVAIPYDEEKATSQYITQYFVGDSIEGTVFIEQK